MATLNQPRLVLKGHDEIFFIDLNKVLYFLADDHYAHVYYASGYHCMVPYGLSKIESYLDELEADTSFMLRLSRKYIININKLQRISTVKAAIVLLDDAGNPLYVRILRHFLGNNVHKISLKRRKVLKSTISRKNPTISRKTLILF